MEIQFSANFSEEIWIANENESNFSLPFNIKSKGDSGSVLRGNEVDYDELPDVFTKVAPAAYPCIIAYAIVFLVAAVGNMIEFLSVWRRLRKRSTAMNRLLLHLCIADIVVVFMVAAVEVFWRISIGWYAGDFMCKLVQYFRAFGLYLSSLMLICLSLDRFYAVVYPLRAVDASRRVKIMLTIAWTAAALCAAPQCIVFRVQSHPDFPAFRQCNSILSGVVAEAINTAISMSFMYFLPILVIIFSYGNIIIKLAKESDGADDGDNSDRFLRRSGASVMDRAKIKTLKLSFVIVMVFVFCWTPYVVISIWHIVDRESAENLNPYIQEALFIMVVANSSVNPLVYGIFNTKKNHHTQPSVSRSGLHESKRRTVIVRGRASVGNEEMITPNKLNNVTVTDSPSETSDSLHHNNHSNLKTLSHS
ncbi:unnamed protein product [Orchesella dallaii]|uniref:G-protein coupled receptors family 1 profile domain-containing protein n=1 Tax=Orchesella dallaii TaxID=48710 RepID=A0ABP1QD31_9HEXA